MHRKARPLANVVLYRNDTLINDRSEVLRTFGAWSSSTENLSLKTLCIVIILERNLQFYPFIAGTGLLEVVFIFIIVVFHQNGMRDWRIAAVAVGWNHVSKVGQVRCHGVWCWHKRSIVIIFDNQVRRHVRNDRYNIVAAANDCSNLVLELGQTSIARSVLLRLSWLPFAVANDCSNLVLEIGQTSITRCVLLLLLLRLSLRCRCC